MHSGKRLLLPSKNIEIEPRRLKNGVEFAEMS